MRIALVNTNRMRPAIGPIGMDYVAEALNAAGYHVGILDLCWAEDWEEAIAEFFDLGHYHLVGVSLRNTDDCTMSSRQSFLGECAAMVKAIRENCSAMIVLGGVGFSVMPETVLSLCRADAGVWGEGEFALIALAERIEKHREWRDAPNIVVQYNGEWRRNPPIVRPLSELPVMKRRWVDNARYFREGGQAGFETKRGCPCQCVYCADPLAKGRTVRTRPAKAVVDEIENLLAQGIDHLHTCDTEFNAAKGHAAEVCNEIVARGLGGRMRWYAYCTPAGFSPDFARLMRKAGCVGINFGVDNGDAGILRRLRREFKPEDIANAVKWCREAGIAVMLDLLLGSPGETRESITRTIEMMKRTQPERVGVSMGVRVYPGTEIAQRFAQEGRKEGLTGGASPNDPVFYLEPAVAPFIVQLLEKLIGDDRGFFFTDPAKADRNYNYNANQRLVKAIQKGFRGAYWDILRRIA